GQLRSREDEARDASRDRGGMPVVGRAACVVLVGFFSGRSSAEDYYQRAGQFQETNEGILHSLQANAHGLAKAMQISGLEPDKQLKRIRTACHRGARAEKHVGRVREPHLHDGFLEAVSGKYRQAQQDSEEVEREAETRLEHLKEV